MESVTTMDKKTITKYIAAFTLGDGGLYVDSKTTKGNARFQANQIIDHKDYVDWRADILRNVTSVNVKQYIPKKQNEKPILQTSTLTHPDYTRVWERMYINKVKVVDPHYMTLFDAESLAILYQDDGSTNYNLDGRIYPQVRIYTLSFSYADNDLLRRAIKENIGLDFGVYRYKSNNGNMFWHLRLNTQQYPLFVSKVKPYIQPSFEYKIKV